MEIQTSKVLGLSGRQFKILCSMLQSAQDPEKKARELGLMRNQKLLELIGERSV